MGSRNKHQMGVVMIGLVVLFLGTTTTTVEGIPCCSGHSSTCCWATNGQTPSLPLTPSAAPAPVTRLPPFLYFTPGAAPTRLPPFLHFTPGAAPAPATRFPPFLPFTPGAAPAPRLSPYLPFTPGATPVPFFPYTPGVAPAPAAIVVPPFLPFTPGAAPAAATIVSKKKVQLGRKAQSIVPLIPH